MKEKVRFLGLDVHAETITVAVAEADCEVRSLGTIANRLVITYALLAPAYVPHKLTIVVLG